MSEGLQITADQAKAARLLLGLAKMNVCRELGITPNTIGRVEVVNAKGGPPPPSIFAKLRRYYEAAGVEFTYDVPPGVRLRLTSEE
jgi:ribosomal protein L30/L7E